MNKKLAASLTIAIFLMSTLAILAPVQAHFTLGLNQPNYPYTIQNFDPHVNGVVGYVWPGGGENTYNGYPTSVNPLLSPGYVAPYPSNAVSNAVGWTQNVKQLDGDEYSPSGAIVTGSTGDLIFAINYTTTGILGTPGQQIPPIGQVYDQFYIALPPEFTGGAIGDNDHVVTTITNNYGNIAWYKLSPYDRFAPGWSLLRITADPQALINFDRGQWYYVRINGVNAPTIAGKYFFKMYLYYSQWGTGTTPATSCGAVCLPRVQYFLPTQNWPVLLVKGELDPAIITGTIRYGGYNSSLYGTPMMEAGMVTAVMKTKLDPYTGATLTGPLTNAVAYFNATANGHYELEGVAPGIYDLYASAAGYPQALIASNVQVMKGQSLHFDGYLNPGPVIHGDVYSKHSFGSEPWPFASDTGPYSGLGYGSPGVGREYIKIELYNAPTVNNVPASNASLVSWSPLPCVAGGQLNYYPGNDAGIGSGVGGTPYEGCGDPRTANTIAFPYHDSPNNGVYAGTGANAVFQGPLSSADPQGVGPAQNWYVIADGVNDKFHYEFGLKGEYGAPSQLDGHVPQLYSTWVNGLTPGRYYARAWVFRYVQTGLDGSTFQEYSFQVTANEWAGDISLPIDLRISSWINKTVHFHDNAGTLLASPISTGANYLAGGLYDANNVMWSYNVTTLTHISQTTGLWTETLGTPNALDKAGLNGGGQFGNCALGNCNIQFWGFNDTWLGENYGIPAGTYTPKVSALGYIQQTFDKVSVTLSGTPVQISNHLYRGVGFNISAYSIDWEQPRVNRNWLYPGNEIGVGIYNGNNTWIGSIPGKTQQSNSYVTEFHGTGIGNAYYVEFGTDPGGSTVYARPGGKLASAGREWTTGTAKNIWNTGGSGWNMPGLSYAMASAWDSGTYKFLGWTYGYIQNKDFVVTVNKGQIADMKINLIIGVNVTLDILFKKEHLISPTPYNMSVRVRIFDDFGDLVGTWMSSEGVYVSSTTGQTLATAASDTALFPDDGGYNYLPAGVNQLHVSIAGLPFAPEVANLGGASSDGPTSPQWANYYYIPTGYTANSATKPSSTCNTAPGGCFVATKNSNGQALGTKYGDPVFSPNGGTFSISNYPADYWSVGGGLPNAHFPYEGIAGQPDYTGTGYTAEVDFVNWYQGTTAVPFSGAVGSSAVTATGPQPTTCDLSGTSCPTYYYPVVPGLLMGESYHIIPGTLAKSGISYTEDGALSTYYQVTLGKEKAPHSMSMNHLGPYSQQGVWTLGPAHDSGETSAIWEVDLNGYVSGTALAFTWSNELRAISWYTVNVAGAGNVTFNSYTSDGIYEFYVVPGQYSMTLSGPGYKSTPLGTISVSSGQSAQPGSGNNIGLPQTNIPVPEFSGIAVVAFSALAASLYLLRRRRQ